MSKKARPVGLLAALLCIMPTLELLGEEAKPVSSRRKKRPVLEVKATPASTPITKEAGKKAEPRPVPRNSSLADSIKAARSASDFSSRDETPRSAAKFTSNSKPSKRTSIKRKQPTGSTAQRLRSVKNSIIYRDLESKSTKQPAAQPLRATRFDSQNLNTTTVNQTATSSISSSSNRTDSAERNAAQDTATSFGETADGENEDFVIPGDETLEPQEASYESETEFEPNASEFNSTELETSRYSTSQESTDFANDETRNRATFASETTTSDQVGEFVAPEEDHIPVPQPIAQQREPVNRATNSAHNAHSMQLSPIEATGPRLAQHFDRADPVASKQTRDDDDVLFESKNPLISVKTRGPRTIVVGKSAKYVIEVSNASDNDAQDLVVNIRIPTWTELRNRKPTVGVARIQPDDRGNNVVQWSVGKLAGRESQRLALDIVPRSSRPFELDVASTFNPVRSLAQIQVREPKLELSVTGPADIPFGTTKVYTLTVSNPGTGDAENVILQLMPLVPTDDSVGVKELGVIKAGTHRSIEVELTAKQTGRLQVRAEVTADGGLVSRSHQDVMVRRASLDIAIQAPQMKYAGTKANFTIKVTNAGDATAGNVIAVATLPSGIHRILANGNASIHENHGQVQWELGSLRPGGSRTLEVEGVLTKAGTNRIDVRTVAKGNLSAVRSANTVVESLADLKLVVNDPKGAIAVGSDVTYEVRIMNRGTKEAQNISVVGYFSEGIEPSKVKGWAGQVSEGQVELDTIKRLGPGQEMLVKITAKASRQGNHVFRAELMCNNPETRLASEEWTRFYGETTTRQAQRSRTRGTARPLQRAK